MESLVTIPIGLVSIAVALIFHGIAFLFKSPKEVQNETTQQLAVMSERHESLSGRHHRLEVDFRVANSSIVTRLDAMNTQIGEINTTLKTVVRQLTAGASHGRHPD